MASCAPLTFLTATLRRGENYVTHWAREDDMPERVKGEAPWQNAERFLRPSKRQSLYVWIVDTDGSMDSGGTEQLAKCLGRSFGRSGMQANWVPTAHLRSIAIEHGLILCSTRRIRAFSKSALANIASASRHSAVGNWGWCAKGPTESSWHL